MVQVSMIDDITGEPLVRRKDDNEETLRKRLTEFHEKVYMFSIDQAIDLQTSPLVGYYQKRGIHTSVDASLKMDVIAQKIDQIFSKFTQKVLIFF